MLVTFEIDSAICFFYKLRIQYSRYFFIVYTVYIFYSVRLARVSLLSSARPLAAASPISSSLYFIIDTSSVSSYLRTRAFSCYSSSLFRQHSSCKLAYSSRISYEI